MKLLSQFVNKSISLFHLGKKWFNQLIASILEAGRTISYVETVNPSQVDTLHKYIKYSEVSILTKEFEKGVRIALSHLGLKNVKVAIDVTEDPYWGKQGYGNTRATVHETSEYSWQFINLAIVDPCFIPLMSLPYRQIDDLDTLTIDLLAYLRTLPLKVTLVLFDRGFYHAHLIDYLESRKSGTPWPYILLARKSEKIRGYLAKTEKIGVFQHTFKYTKHKSAWKPTTTLVLCKAVGRTRNGTPIDWCFATNQKASISLVFEYKKRWNIETGFRVHDETQIKSKSAHPLIRYFYHLTGMVLILMWRLHNHVETYVVFKRYLKQLELYCTLEVYKPPT